MASSCTKTLSDFYQASVVDICYQSAKQHGLNAMLWYNAEKIFGLEPVPDIKQSLVGPNKVSVSLIGEPDTYTILLCNNMMILDKSTENVFRCEAGIYIYIDADDALNTIMQKGRSQALGITLYSKEITLQQMAIEANLDSREQKNMRKVIEENMDDFGFSKGRKEHTHMRNILLQKGRVVFNVIVSQLKGDDNELFSKLLLTMSAGWGKNIKQMMNKGWTRWLQQLWITYQGVLESGVGKVLNINQEVFDNFLHGYSCAQCKTQPQTRKDHKKCGRCQVVYYCSKECQKMHWLLHKHDCVIQPT